MADSLGERCRHRHEEAAHGAVSHPRSKNASGAEAEHHVYAGSLICEGSATAEPASKF
jgi:hypothetical protein